MSRRSSGGQRPRWRFKERRRASCRLESVESVRFREAVAAEQAAEDAASRPSPRLRAAILAKFLQLVAERSHCVACSRADPECGGSWIAPKERSASLGLPPDVAPVFVYRICLECARKLRAGDRATRERVEAYAMANYTEDRATYVPAETPPDP
jgi:hypothetical protein